jgi:hypothetical protein
MPLCKNPECQKEVPENKIYCKQECLQRHLELKKIERKGLVLNGEEEDIWLGQKRRKRAMDIILNLAKETCPISSSKFVSYVSYRTGLSRRKVRDDYLETLIDVALLELEKGILHYIGKGDRFG